MASRRGGGGASKRVNRRRMRRVAMAPAAVATLHKLGGRVERELAGGELLCCCCWYNSLDRRRWLVESALRSGLREHIRCVHELVVTEVVAKGSPAIRAAELLSASTHDVGESRWVASDPDVGELAKLVKRIFNFAFLCNVMWGDGRTAVTRSRIPLRTMSSASTHYHARAE